MPRRQPLQMQIFGAHKDDTDTRDIPYVPEMAPKALPASVSLRTLCTQVYDQMPMMACTSNAIAALFDAVAAKAQQQLFTPSRLFIYYNERDAEGTVDEDKGAQLRTGLKVLARYGVCSETLWPYENARLFQRPTGDAYAAAEKTRIYEYRRISHTASDIKSCLASGYPFVAGLELYHSAMPSFTSGVLPMPQTSEAVLGGHAALCIGYDDAQQRFTFLNSMGPSWGAQGCFSVPYAYLTSPQLTYDMWTFRGITCSQ